MKEVIHALHKAQDKLTENEVIIIYEIIFTTEIPYTFHVVTVSMYGGNTYVCVYHVNANKSIIVL